MFYPIYLDLHGRPCLVVGGGPIATGKVRGLVEAGALVTVVAPAVSADVVAWHESRELVWHQREFAATSRNNTAGVDTRECRSWPVFACHWPRLKEALPPLVVKRLMTAL